MKQGERKQRAGGRAAPEFARGRRGSQSGGAPSISERRVRRGSLAAVVSGVCVATLFTHWPARQARVTFIDDHQYWKENLLVQHPSWHSAGRFLSEVLEPSTVRGYYQPLAMISLMLDHARGGRSYDLQPFHDTSLALHTANAALVVMLFYLLFGNVWLAGFLGLIFGVHPLTVESITWVSERKTLLATFFALGSLACYVRYAQRGGWAACLLAVLLYVLALLSKPTSLPLPAVMILLDFWPLRRLRVRTLLEKVPLWAVAALFAVITIVSQARTARVVMPQERTMTEIVLTLCHGFATYPGRFVWPRHLAAFYAIPETFSWAQPALLIGVLGTAALAAAMLISLRWTRAGLAGGLVFLVLVLPTLGLLGFTIVFDANKYTYLPMLGGLLIVAAAAGWVQRRGGARGRAALLLAGGLTTLGLGAETRAYLAYWQDDEKFYRHMLTISPRAGALHNHLGLVLLQQGRLDEAESEFQVALAIDADGLQLHGNLGTLYSRRGEYALAIQHLSRAVELEPQSERGYVNLGNALARAGRTEEALATWEQALALNPDNAATHSNLGNGLRALGRTAEAIEQYGAALRLQPEHGEANFNLASALLYSGPRDAALRQVDRALQVRPACADALCNLAADLLAHGRRDVAIETYGAILRRQPAHARAREELQAAQSAPTPPASSS